MVKYCCAFKCKEKFIKGGLLSFHCFPKDENRRKLWEIAVRKGKEGFEASYVTNICSKHFTPESFDVSKFGGTWLKKDAVPTIFEFPAHMMKINTFRKPKANFKNSGGVDFQEEPPKEDFWVQSSKLNYCGSTENDITSNKPINEIKNENSSKGSSKSRDNKRLHYLGDFSIDDMDSPEKAKKMFQIATSNHRILYKKMKSIRNNNAFLKKRIASLKEILKKHRMKRPINKEANGVFEGIHDTKEEIAVPNINGPSTSTDLDSQSNNYDAKVVDPMVLLRPGVPLDDCSLSGPASRIKQPPILVDNVHLAMTCEVYPADEVYTKKELPEKIIKLDILSPTVERNLNNCSKKSEDSLFEAPALIKEELVSSEEET